MTIDTLKQITAWDTVPAVTEAELNSILAASSLADGEGLKPEDVGWEPTYDINAAASAVWLIKAGRASNTTESGADPLAVTSRVFGNCMRMARLYARKRASSVKF